MGFSDDITGSDHRVEVLSDNSQDEKCLGYKSEGWSGQNHDRPEPDNLCCFGRL